MRKIKIIKETEKGEEDMIIITLSDWIIQLLALCFAILELSFAFILFAMGFMLFCLVSYIVVDFFKI